MNKNITLYGGVLYLIAFYMSNTLTQTNCNFLLFQLFIEGSKKSELLSKVNWEPNTQKRETVLKLTSLYSGQPLSIVAERKPSHQWKNQRTKQTIEAFFLL